VWLFNSAMVSSATNLRCSIEIVSVGGSKYSITGHAHRVEGSAGTLTGGVAYYSHFYGTWDAGTGNTLRRVYFYYAGRAWGTLTSVNSFTCMYLS
jgi:hypothetical protein